MTSDHYSTLRVAPAAEDTVVRAAYRALMRLYHPDKNSDPGAQERVREINAAFAVLGNPSKRAAYDALPSLRSLSWVFEQPEMGPDQRSHPPMRNVGLATIALAIILVVAIWPQDNLATGPQEKTAAASLPTAAQADFVVDPPPPRRSVARDHDALRPVVSPEVEPFARVAPGHDAILADLPKKPLLTPKREMVRVPGSQARASIIAHGPTTTRVARSAARANCGRGSSTVGSDECRDQIATLKRMADSFFGQSMAHADGSKQQLLLTARHRSATSRNGCRTNECVREAYARQIGETGAIMEGRPPAQ